MLHAETGTMPNAEVTAHLVTNNMHEKITRFWLAVTPVQKV